MSADRNQTRTHSPDRSQTQCQNSSKDSGISGSTKTDIDLMKCLDIELINSNDEDDSEKAEKIDIVGSPPPRRKAIVRTVNNDAKV